MSDLFSFLHRRDGRAERVTRIVVPPDLEARAKALFPGATVEVDDRLLPDTWRAYTEQAPPIVTLPAG